MMKFLELVYLPENEDIPSGVLLHIFSVLRSKIASSIFNGSTRKLIATLFTITKVSS